MAKIEKPVDLDRDTLDRLNRDEDARLNEVFLKWKAIRKENTREGIEHSLNAVLRTPPVMLNLETEED